MNSSELVQALVAAFEAKNIDKAAEFLTDDFVFDGVSPVPINKEAFLAMEQAVHQAFPDYRNNQRVLEEQGEMVKAVVQNTGTHTGIFDLSALGLPFPPVAPTGIQLKMPVEEVKYYVRGGKIYRMTAEPVPGGGVPGMLQQIGVILSAPVQ